MKLNKKIVLGLAALSLATFVGKANAETYEISKLDTTPTLKLNATTGSAGTSLQIDYANIKDVSKYTHLAMKFVGDSFEVNDEVCNNAATISKSSGDLSTTYFYGYTDKGMFSVDRSIYYTSGFDKAVVIATYTDDDYTKHCYYSDPVTITKDSLISEGNRYKVFFNGDSENRDFTIFPYFPYNDDFKVNVKVGSVTSELIKKYANSSSDAYSSLKAYAKSDSGLKTLSNVQPDKSTDIVLNTTSGSFYYIYVDPVYNDSYEHYDVSDVYLVQADNAGQLVTDVDYTGYTTDNTKTTTKTEKTTNPKTGVKDYLVPGVIVIALAGAAFVVTKNKGSFKRI